MPLIIRKAHDDDEAIFPGVGRPELRIRDDGCVEVWKNVYTTYSMQDFHVFIHIAPTIFTPSTATRVILRLQGQTAGFLMWGENFPLFFVLLS